MTEVDFEAATLSQEFETQFSSRRSTRLEIVAHQLLDVEILYLLSRKPESMQGITRSLSSTFGLIVTPATVFARTTFLKSEGLVQMILRSAIGPDLSGECYTITPQGIEILSSWIDSLAEITLTMQLGINEKIALAE